MRITEAQIWSKIIPKTAKNLLAEKKTSPNETVHRKKHFKHSLGGRGRWEIRKKDENEAQFFLCDSYKKESV